MAHQDHPAGRGVPAIDEPAACEEQNHAAYPQTDETRIPGAQRARLNAPDKMDVGDPWRSTAALLFII